MASAVSASASAQVLPTSLIMTAENSCLRRRSSSPARNSSSLRSAAGTRFQLSKARAATRTAWSACSRLPFEITPRTWSLFEGLIEVKVVSPATHRPSMSRS
jgi:hypothetical protein